MTLTPPKFFTLNGNALKIFACACMLLDHIGYIFFPQVTFLRAIGRLALPIFAFFIAEGCKYTHDKPRYLLFMALSGVIMMTVQYAFLGVFFGNIFVQFSLSILLIYTFQKLKTVLFETKLDIFRQVFWFIAFVAIFTFCRVSSEILSVDYGFLGVMLPFFASIPNLRGIDAGNLNRFDTLPARLLFLGIALLALAIDLGGLQYLALFALIPLASYDGQRGRQKLKYFFYIFYPAHLVLLYGIALIL